MTATYVRRVQYTISCNTCSLLRVLYNPLEAQQLLDAHNTPGACQPAPYQGGDPRPYRARRSDRARS